MILNIIIGVILGRFIYESLALIANCTFIKIKQIRRDRQIQKRRKNQWKELNNGK